MAERDAVFPANPHALFAMHRYSPAIRSNGFLFVSGQVGALPDGSPEPDSRAQIRLALDHLVATLDAAGCSFDDIIDTTFFMIDPEATLPILFDVLGEYWGEPPYPAVTAIGVTWLSGFQFEIKVVARLPEAENAA